MSWKCRPVVSVGAPEDVARSRKSHTGKFLKRALSVAARANGG